MALNLLNAVQQLVTPDAVHNTSSMLGESETSTRSALQGAVPSVFGGMINMVSSGDGANNLTNMIHEGNFGSLADHASSAFSGGSATSEVIKSGEGLIGSIFGGKSSAVADSISSHSGVRSSSATSILSMVAPLVMGAIAKRAGSGLSASSLTSMLMGEREAVAAAAPSGISQLLGFGGIRQVADVSRAESYEMPKTGTYGGATTYSQRTGSYAETPRRDVARPTPYAVSEPRREATGMKWLPVLLLALLALGLLMFLRNRHPAATVGNVAETARNAMASVTLPGGVNLSVPEGSINYNLSHYLADSSATAPRNFVFDHLNFESASTQLTPDSQQTITGLAAVLKAYPNVQAQLAGFTDNTGAADANQQLSLARANAVRDQLVQQGVNANRLSTAGYGQDRPIASNDTDEGRLKNRRLELTVLQK
jgi:outer membrane protein OmpA-like peptidoglycan-associated protein